MERMIEQMKEMLRTLGDDPELFSLLARTMKKGYDALVVAGFTEEQATRIIAGQGMGIKTS